LNCGGYFYRHTEREGKNFWGEQGNYLRVTRVVRRGTKVPQMTACWVGLKEKKKTEARYTTRFGADRAALGGDLRGHPGVTSRGVILRNQRKHGWDGKRVVIPPSGVVRDQNDGTQENDLSLEYGRGSASSSGGGWKTFIKRSLAQ